MTDGSTIACYMLRGAAVIAAVIGVIMKPHAVLSRVDPCAR